MTQESNPDLGSPGAAAPKNSASSSHSTPGTRALGVVSALIAVGLGLARALVGLSLPLVAAIAVGAAGAILWLPTWRKLDSRAALGTALATGAVISGMFFVLAVRDEHKQQEIAQGEALALQLTLQHNLSQVDLSNDHLSRFDLTNKDLAGADLFDVDLADGHLKGANLDGASLNLAHLYNTGMRGASLVGASIDGAVLDEANLNEADLTGASFGVYHGYKSASLSQTKLIDVGLRGGCLAKADLHGAELGGADLTNADFDYADLTGARFMNDGVAADVQGTSFFHARLDVSGRQFIATHWGATHSSGVAPSLVPAPPRAPVLQVTGYSDGDTFRLATLGWVRLIGVNAPEPSSSEPVGKAARRFIKQVLSKGTLVRYELGRRRQERKPGKTGRSLVYVWTKSGEFLNEELLLMGYGLRETDQGEGSRYSREFAAAQQYARKAGRGVWAYCPDFPANDSSIPR